MLSNVQKSFYLVEQVGENFCVRGEQSLPATSSSATHVTVNDTFTKFLVNQDRFLRLYQVHYPSGDGETAMFELLDTFQDVINHNRWLNC